MKPQLQKNDAETLKELNAELQGLIHARTQNVRQMWAVRHMPALWQSSRMPELEEYSRTVNNSIRRVRRAIEKVERKIQNDREIVSSKSKNYTRPIPSGK